MNQDSQGKEAAACVWVFKAHATTTVSFFTQVCRTALKIVNTVAKLPWIQSYYLHVVIKLMKYCINHMNILSIHTSVPSDDGFVSFGLSTFKTSGFFVTGGFHFFED